MSDEQYVEIPWNELDPDTLRALVEEFVTRDGTDYGEVEVSLASRVEDVIRGLQKKRWVIVFDARLESVTILDVREWQRRQSGM